MQDPQRRDVAQELRMFRNLSDALHLKMDKCPGITPIVHAVVDQLRMTLGRDTLPNSIQESFVGNRVLVVTKMVTGIGQQFYERDTEVRRTAFQPLRIELGNKIKFKLPKARVVLG